MMLCDFGQLFVFSGPLASLSVQRAMLIHEGWGSDEKILLGTGCKGVYHLQRT